jgi:hypothetical protein
MLLSGKGCTESKKAKCKARSGPYLEILCRNCLDKDYEPDPYVISLYQTAMLAEAGFPFSSDGFDMTYWTDLGVFRFALRQKSLTAIF